MTALPTVGDGMVVAFHYTLSDASGEVIDRSEGREPLAYLHGAGNIVPGLERQLMGRRVGERFDAVVAPEDGYGLPSGPGPQPVPRKNFPEDIVITPGMQFVAQQPDGSPLAVFVVDVDAMVVTIDTNHPLAGETLHFTVEVASIREATIEEVEHGHPHGPGGHH